MPAWVLMVRVVLKPKIGDRGFQNLKLTKGDCRRMVYRLDIYCDMRSRPTCVPLSPVGFQIDEMGML